MPNAWFSTKQLLIEMERGIIISAPFSIVELMPISPLVNVEINDKSEIRYNKFRKLKSS